MTAPAWFPDELDYAGRENLDADHVARYDAKEDAGAAAEVTLLREFGLDGGSLVVDIGAGTGQFTLAAAAVCDRVIAVDVSPVMLSRLAAKVVAAGLGNVEIVRAGFLSYCHAQRAADVVYSRYALHHLPDFWKVIALQRVHDILRPGGILRLSDVVFLMTPAEIEQRIEGWCATGGDGVVGEWSRAELEEHVRDEHSTFTWVLEPMIDRCGFEIARSEYTDDGIFAHYLLRAR